MQHELNRLLKADIDQYQQQLLTVLQKMTQNPMQPAWLDEGLLITHTLKALAAVRGLPEMEQVSAQLEQVFSQAKTLPLVAAEHLLTPDLTKLYKQLAKTSSGQSKAWSQQRTQQHLNHLIESIQHQQDVLQSKPQKRPPVSARKTTDQIDVLDLFYTFGPWLHLTQAEVGKQYTVTYTNPSDITISPALCQMLQRVFVHLLRNAVYHGIEKPEYRALHQKSPIGCIELRAELLRDQLQLSVTDDGSGITDKPSHQNDAESGSNELSLQNQLTGLGVGLHIVRSEVERYNGSFTLQSIPTQGAAAMIRLPQSTHWTVKP